MIESEHKTGQLEPHPSPAAAWRAVAVLSGLYMFSFVDRQILVLLIEPIKEDLGLTDTGVSLLTGLAFAAVYAVMGVPMGRAADLWSRKRVILFGATLWSLLTILCGFARDFKELFVARMGVGLGEAALTPAGYAMVADLFPPEKLARGMSVFVIGGVVGSGLSLILGGIVIDLVERIGVISLPILGEIRVWQLALLTVGTLSLLMVIPLIFVGEPARKRSSGSGGQTGGFSSVLGHMARRWRFFVCYVFGMSVVSLYFYGSSAWFPTYFIRVYEWSPGSIGMTLGAVSLPCLLAGALAAGWCSDYLGRRGVSAPSIRILLTVVVLSLPLPFATIVVNPIEAKFLLLGISYIFFGAIIVMAPIAIQLASPVQMRAQVSAIYLLVANLISIGCGPTVIALITDYGFADELRVGASIAIVGTFCFALGAILLNSSIAGFRQTQAALELCSENDGVPALAKVARARAAPL